MAFQAVIGTKSLKSFTKSLTCLSRYGDDVVLQALQDSLILTTTNSSKSAFCRIKLTSEYFDKYKVKPLTAPGSTFQTPPDAEESEKITGQLLVKSLLSILKHKTVEKSVDRCDLSIVEGGDSDQTLDSEEDSLESKLVVRLHCKHGVVKTHRLLLMTPTSSSLMGPQILSPPAVSRVTIGPRALRDILEHFPHAKGTKSDPQLVWLFALNDIKVKSMQLGDMKGKSQISTEIKMSADEFDSYNIHEPPVSLGFHLREFNATIALAESLSVALDLQFTEPVYPIYIEFDTDSSDSEFFFVISSTQTVWDSPVPSKAPGAANLRKRVREDDREEENPGDPSESMARVVKKKPLPAAIRASSSGASQNTPEGNRSSSQPVIPRNDQVNDNDAPVSGAPEQLLGPESLFMPGASQLSNADLELLRSSGLGIEHMDFEEFEAMMEAEGEEVGMSTAIGKTGDDDEKASTQERAESVMDYDQHIPSSQVPVKRRGDKEFRPLFED